VSHAGDILQDKNKLYFVWFMACVSLDSPIGNEEERRSLGLYLTNTRRDS